MTGQPQANHLRCEGLSIRVPGRELVTELSLSIPEGSLTAVLGKNGSGKTLTLHTLAGLRPNISGEIYLADKAISSLNRMDIANRLGLLLQTHEDPFPVSVEEMVLMGCYARRGMWQRESSGDIAAAEAALQEFDLTHLSERSVSTLSGGERRRVALAAMRLQNPDIWLLDEPTNHLDPKHQADLFASLLRLKSEGKSIVTSLHDPSLAVRFADFALLVSGNGDWSFGPVNELVTPERLSELYGVPYKLLSDGDLQVLVTA